MIYQDKSKEELISCMKEIHQKHCTLMELSEINAAAHKTDIESLKASESRYRRVAMII